MIKRFGLALSTVALLVLGLGAAHAAVPAVDITGPADGAEVLNVPTLPEEAGMQIRTDIITGTSSGTVDSLQVSVTGATFGTAAHGDAVVAADGTWTYEPPFPLLPDMYQVTAIADGPDGTASDSITITVT